MAVNAGSNTVSLFEISHGNATKLTMIGYVKNCAWFPFLLGTGVFLEKLHESCKAYIFKEKGVPAQFSSSSAPKSLAKSYTDLSIEPSKVFPLAL